MIVPDFIERSKRKTLSLTILKDGMIVVRAPLNMQDSVINKFVEDKQSWIKEKIGTIKENINKFEDVIGYQNALLYGNKYKLISACTKQVETNDKFEILLPERLEKEKQLKLLKLWYKKIAKKVLSDRLKFIENRTNLHAASFKIGDSRGRWGSCNSIGSVILNWRVVMLPTKIIDYVIVHELCHLVELNHSKNFWSLVGKFLPNYEIQRQNIKEYGFLLNMF